MIDRYREYMEDQADGAIKGILGQEADIEPVKDLIADAVSESVKAADEVVQELARTAERGEVEVASIFSRYEAARSIVNERSVYEHQLKRSSKIPASLNHLATIRDYTKDLLLPEGL